MQMTSKTTRTPVPKLWGEEDWIINTPQYCGKVLTLRPGYQSSLHYHPLKHETFVCMVGNVCLEMFPEGVTRLGKPAGAVRTLYMSSTMRNAVTLEPGVPHRFYCTTKSPAVVVEFSTHHSDTDVVRLEDSRKQTLNDL